MSAKLLEGQTDRQYLCNGSVGELAVGFTPEALYLVVGATARAVATVPQLGPTRGYPCVRAHSDRRSRARGGGPAKFLGRAKRRVRASPDSSANGQMPRACGNARAAMGGAVGARCILVKCTV